MKVQRTKDIQEPLRKKQKKKKKAARVFGWIRFLLIIALLSTTIAYGASSPYFNVKTVQLKGTAAHYDEKTLAGRTGIVTGVNGFKLLFVNPGKFYFFRVGAAEKAILESCPYVKSVKVRYIPPSRITIEVQERTASAVLITGGTNLLIDREEVLLEMATNFKKSSLPVIKVERPAELKPGKKLELRTGAMNEAYQVYDAIVKVDSQNQDKLLPSVNYVDVTDPDKTGFMLQSRVYVNLGGLDKLDDLIYRLNAVKTVFTNNIEKDIKGKLDFTSDGKPVFTPENRG